MEAKPKPVLQPKEKLKPGKNPKVSSMAGGCPWLSVLCSGVCAASEPAEYQSRPTPECLHDRCARIWGGLVAIMQPWWPIPWPGPCSWAAWELPVFAGRAVCLSQLELTAFWRNLFLSPNSQHTCKCLTLVWTSFLVKKYCIVCIPCFVGWFCVGSVFILRMGLNSYFVSS